MTGTPAAIARWGAAQPAVGEVHVRFRQQLVEREELGDPRVGRDRDGQGADLAAEGGHHDDVQIGQAELPGKTAVLRGGRAHPAKQGSPSAQLGDSLE
jgi:hypothetical protein